MEEKVTQKVNRFRVYREISVSAESGLLTTNEKVTNFRVSNF